MFVDLDTNEVMVPFKTKSGGHRLAVGVPYAGGGTPPPPRPHGPAAARPPLSSPSAAAGRASNPTPGPLPRPTQAPGGQWPRPEPPRGAWGPGGAVRPGWSWGTRRRRAASRRPEPPASRPQPPLSTVRAGLFCPGGPARTRGPKPGGQREPALRADCSTQRAKSGVGRPSPRSQGP